MHKQYNGDSGNNSNGADSNSDDGDSADSGGKSPTMYVMVVLGISTGRWWLLSI